MDNSKDIALAVFGGGVSLAGLLLVFSGFLFSQSASFDQETVDEELINRYRRAAKFGVVPFGLCLGLSAAALWWLRNPSDMAFAVILIGFVALLVITAGYGGYVILKYL